MWKKIKKITIVENKEILIAACVSYIIYCLLAIFHLHLGLNYLILILVVDFVIFAFGIRYALDVYEESETEAIKFVANMAFTLVLNHIFAGVTGYCFP